MPFRTKDFALFIVTVAFLLIGITSTVARDLAGLSQGASVITYSDTEETIYSAAEIEVASDERPGRLAVLRDKISKLKLSASPAKVQPEPEEVVAEENNASIPGEVTTCPGFGPATIAWSPQGLKFEVVEGARIVYREVESVPALDEFGQVVPTAPTRDLVLQLPLRSFPAGQISCLSTDVVGVALDGSLIRNNDNNLYKVFGSETLIGYALDGFPIHGLSNSKTDQCGGSDDAGEYRYYLSSEREGVLGCFSGAPVKL
jgi:hypothetical protein